jgi:PAS domain S-box-containing protein
MGEGAPIWDRLVDALPYIVYVYNLAERRIELANRSVAAELGYTVEQMVALGDRIIPDLVHPDDLPRVPELLARWEHAADGEVLESELRLRHADGSWRWFLGRDLVLDRDERGRARRLVGTLLDISKRVELEQSLARAQTLEAVGRLAGGVAHDFNNLLTAIMANVALAQRSVSAARPTEATLDHIEQIGRVADDAARLTRQLLTFARQKSSRPEIVDANAALLELRPMLRRLIEENVELVWQLDPDAPPIAIDPASFTQVILNLATNARDAVPAGRPGVLTVRTADRDGSLELTVEDNGVGMSAEVARRIFEPFFSTKGATASGTSGTGLGLSTVYGILRECGASVDVTSQPGRGTRFAIVFPPIKTTVREPPVQLRAARRSARRPPGTLAGSVLLVEDNPALAEATAAFLEDAGLRVRVAPDGESGLEMFRACRDDLDLVISDVVMPRLSGRELARRVLAEKPGIKLLLWSGYADTAPGQGRGQGQETTGDKLDLPPGPRDPSREGAGYRFTSKPLLPDDLLDLIADLLSGRR